jgi:hypothetical protein
MTIESLYRRFASSPESSWIMKPNNARDLYNWVKEHKVKKVLGLGTGIGLSDCIIILALLDKGETDFHLDSIEQFDKCIDLANQLIPEEFKKYITIHKSNVMAWKNEKMPYDWYSVYETIPEGDYDLIVNDGPSPFMDGEVYVDIPNGTVHKMLLGGKIKPGAFVAYDRRIASLQTLERYFADNFYICYMPEGGNFHILERKDNKEVVLRDDKFEAIKEQTNYFQNNEKNMLSGAKQSASGPTEVIA